MARGNGLELDSSVRHSFSSWDGWAEFLARAAHALSWSSRRCCFMDRDRHGRGLLPLQFVTDTCRDSWSPALARLVPFLLLVGTDACPHVLPHFYLGTRRPNPCGGQVLPFYSTERVIDADRSSGSLFCASPGNGCLHFRVSGPSRHAARSSCSNVDYARLPRRLRGEAAYLSIPHLASRCMRRSFRGDQPGTGEPDGRYCGVRHDPLPSTALS